MKKFIILFFFILFQTGVFAQNTDNSDEISSLKYTVIKTTHNYSPVREQADINAKRTTHLKKGTTLYSDKMSNNFYRIDLGLDKYYWIEKKYADVDFLSDEKEIPVIKDIEFTQDENYWNIKLKTPIVTAYNEIETSKNSLDFIIYDVILDKENLLITGKNSADFKISKDEFDNLKISYYSNYPLSGHEVVPYEEGIILKVKKPFKKRGRKTLSKYVFVIDPGHGGSEPGACANGLKEKDINLEISKILKHDLKKEGASVYLTRDDDTNPDLYERIDFAKEKNADFLLSIHQNSLANPKNVDKKHGVGVYYYNKESYELSKEIQNALVTETNFQDDGVNLASFALTRACNPICILIECGYIIHPFEAKMISDEKFQQKISKAIIKGSKNYLKKNYL